MSNVDSSSKQVKWRQPVLAGALGLVALAGASSRLGKGEGWGRIADVAVIALVLIGSLLFALAVVLKLSNRP